MNNKSKYLITLGTIIVAVSLVSAAVIINIGNKDIDDDKKLEYFYSFEKDMENWQKNGTDLDNPPINWTVERSNEMATDGNYSVKFYLENFNDAGKIWMEKTFNYDPNSVYLVNISYNFASADFGEFNLFKIITTVLSGNFTGREDLNYEEETGNNLQEEGYAWLEKDYEYIIETDDLGEIYINIGVWGSWETTRTYFLDELNISFVKQETIEEYPDISGNWTLKNYNYEGKLSSEENVTINQNEGNIEIQFQPFIKVQGTIIKNNIEYPYKESEFIIKGCDFKGLGIDVIYIVNESYMITEMPACEQCIPSVFTR